MNGKPVSRDLYKKQLQDQGFDEAGATVTFTGAVEVPADPDNAIQVSLNSIFEKKIVLMILPGRYSGALLYCYHQREHRHPRRAGSEPDHIVVKPRVRWFVFRVSLA